MNTTLAQALKGQRLPKLSISEVKNPVWTGPSREGPQGGVTQSLLSRFLVCRERFRLLVVEGLKLADSFSHRLEFGSMWHVCEENLAKSPRAINNLLSHIGVPLTHYCQHLCKRYPTQQGEVDKYYQLCKVMFPLYVEHWSRNKEEKNRTPLLQEQKFDVPYKLSSGRMVRLRGKFDAADLIGKGRGSGIYLFETKTKGDINEQQIVRQLSFDLQTMLYLIALQSVQHDYVTDTPGDALGEWGNSILGVRYNVIRRPLSGGKGDVRLRKDESIASLCERLEEKIREEPGNWFMRWKVEVSQADIDKFRRECLDPILEQLCDWWEWIMLSSRFGPKSSPFDAGPYKVGEPGTGKAGDGIHWRLPYGIFNPLAEGKSSDLDHHLANGSTVGLQRTSELFPELA
jgi:hypothetical protein